MTPLLSGQLSASDILAIRFSTNPSDHVPAEYKELVDTIKERAYSSGHDDGWKAACEQHRVDDIDGLELELGQAQTKTTDLIIELKEIYKLLCAGETDAAKEAVHRRLSDEGEL